MAFCLLLGSKWVYLNLFLFYFFLFFFFYFIFFCLSFIFFFFFVLFVLFLVFFLFNFFVVVLFCFYLFLFLHWLRFQSCIAPQLQSNPSTIRDRTFFISVGFLYLVLRFLTFKILCYEIVTHFYIKKSLPTLSWEEPSIAPLIYKVRKDIYAAFQLYSASDLSA